MFDAILPLLQTLHLSIFLKVVVLIILALYIVFTFVLLTQIRALNRLVFIAAFNASRLLYVFSLVYFLLSISLFVFTLVIL